MKEKGFTLIELVVVIVILGILAATALPRFMDMRGSAAQAAVDGVAGALSSAASINYAGRLAAATNGCVVTNCAAVSNALQGGLPNGYSVGGPAVTSGGSVSNCTVQMTAGGQTYTQNYTAIGA